LRILARWGTRRAETFDELVLLQLAGLDVVPAAPEANHHLGIAVLVSPVSAPG